MRVWKLVLLLRVAHRSGIQLRKGTISCSKLLRSNMCTLLQITGTLSRQPRLMGLLRNSFRMVMPRILGMLFPRHTLYIMEVLRRRNYTP